MKKAHIIIQRIRAIITQKNNYFLYADTTSTQGEEVSTKVVNCYMGPDGKRFVSKGEVTTGNLPTTNEWGWAKKNWKNTEVIDIPEHLKTSAEELIMELSNPKKKYSGFSKEQLEERLKKNRGTQLVIVNTVKGSYNKLVPATQNLGEVLENKGFKKNAK